MFIDSSIVFLILLQKINNFKQGKFTTSTKHITYFHYSLLDFDNIINLQNISKQERTPP